MSKKNQYPYIVNRGEIHENRYIGIMYNGDQRVYRKATVKALKKEGAEKSLIKAVKAADGDLAISRTLIEADRFDILVDVFTPTDARTAVWDYIESSRDDIVNDFKDDMSNLEKSIAKTASNLSKDADHAVVLDEIDKSIDEQCEAALEKLGVCNETAKEVLRKYHEACVNKLKELNKERQKLLAEKKRLEALLSKV